MRSRRSRRGSGPAGRAPPSRATTARRSSTGDADARRAIECLVELQARAGGNALVGRQLFPMLVAAGLRDVRAIEDVAAREKTYAAARAFLSEFRRAYGSDVCRVLLGVDIGTPEGHAEAVNAGLFQDALPRARPQRRADRRVARLTGAAGRP